MYIYDLQHGFREKRSCETQLIMLIENLARNTGVCKKTDIILLDLQQTACWVEIPITVGNFAFPFNCTPVGRTSDSMTVPA